MWLRFQLNGDAVHDLDSMHSATHKRGAASGVGPGLPRAEGFCAGQGSLAALSFNYVCAFFFGVLCVVLQCNGVCRYFGWTVVASELSVL